MEIAALYVVSQGDLDTVLDGLDNVPACDPLLIFFSCFRFPSPSSHLLEARSTAGLVLRH